MSKFAKRTFFSILRKKSGESGTNTFCSWKKVSKTTIFTTSCGETTCQMCNRIFLRMLSVWLNRLSILQPNQQSRWSYFHFIGAPFKYVFSESSLKTEHFCLYVNFWLNCERVYVPKLYFWKIYRYILKYICPASHRDSVWILRYCRPPDLKT